LATIVLGWRNHHDKDQPHARVLIRGKRASGGDLVIPRKVISHGTHGQITSGRAEGFVEGHVTTSMGKQAIINRGLGYGALAVKASQ
jgi:hypothetical protein